MPKQLKKPLGRYSINIGCHHSPSSKTDHMISLLSLHSFPVCGGFSFISTKGTISYFWDGVTAPCTLPCVSLINETTKKTDSLFVYLFGFLTSPSSTTRLYRGWAPRQFYVLRHMRQSWETMTFVSAGHIILTHTQSVGSGRPSGIKPLISSPGVARSID